MDVSMHGTACDVMLVACTLSREFVQPLLYEPAQTVTMITMGRAAMGLAACCHVPQHHMQLSPAHQMDNVHTAHTVCSTSTARCWQTSI